MIGPLRQAMRRLASRARQLAPNHGAHGEREIPLRPLPWWIVLLAVTLVVIVTWAVTGWLLRIAAGDPTRQIEAIKTGLTAGAGTGGAVALLLAVRRQWSAEVSTVHTTHDAAERRLTELYTKAADQLGSDKAPVRFAGLYALERLADANPQQRQTIVNLLCAYLRMPYQPADNSLLTSKGKPAELELRYDKYRKQREEGEVRNAAQRIVTRHLNPRNYDYWGGPDREIDLDLEGADIRSFNVSNCRLGTARFSRATFSKGSNFEETIFTQASDFQHATFQGGCRFHLATFNQGAWFGNCQFPGPAVFTLAVFSQGFDFGNSTFSKLRADNLWRGSLVQSRYAKVSAFPPGLSLGEELDNGWYKLAYSFRAANPDTSAKLENSRQSIRALGKSAIPSSVVESVRSLRHQFKSVLPRCELSSLTGVRGTRAKTKSAIAAAVIAHDGRVLLVRARAKGMVSWTFPAGTIEDGESASQAATRQVRQAADLGVVSSKVLGDQVHPTTGRKVIYVACDLLDGNSFVVPYSRSSDCCWMKRAELKEYFPYGFFEPVRAHLEVIHASEVRRLKDRKAH